MPRLQPSFDPRCYAPSGLGGSSVTLPHVMPGDARIDRGALSDNIWKDPAAEPALSVLEPVSVNVENRCRPSLPSRTAICTERWGRLHVPRILPRPTRINGKSQRVATRPRYGPSGSHHHENSIVLHQAVAEMFGIRRLLVARHGENASTFSPSAIKTRITRLIASLSCCWERDRQPDGFDDALGTKHPDRHAFC
jgi:hypothetical protein